MKRKLLLIAFLMTMNAQSFADTSDQAPDSMALKQPITVTNTDKIKGLAEVKKRGKFHHSFVYETEAGERMELKSKIKGVKDLRPQSVAHPYQTGTRAFCAKHNAQAQFTTSCISAICYVIGLFK